MDIMIKDLKKKYDEIRYMASVWRGRIEIAKYWLSKKPWDEYLFPSEKAQQLYYIAELEEARYNYDYYSKECKNLKLQIKNTQRYEATTTK